MDIEKIILREVTSVRKTNITNSLSSVVPSFKSSDVSIQHEEIREMDNERWRQRLSVELQDTDYLKWKIK